MKIDVTKAIKNYDGTPLLGPDGLRSAEAIAMLSTLKANITPQDLAKAFEAVTGPLTLREAACGALMGTYKDEENLAGQDKARRWCLARQLFEDPAPDLPVEDVALLKQLIAKRYHASVVGPAWQMLEGN